VIAEFIVPFVARNAKSCAGLKTVVVHGRSKMDCACRNRNSMPTTLAASDELKRYQNTSECQWRT